MVVANKGERDSRTVNDESRRRFLALAAGGLSTVVASLMGIPLVGMFLGPLFTRREERWIDLGDITALKPDQPTRLTYSYVKIDGWFEKTVHGSAYVVSEQSELVALSNICTHLGCGVRWDATRGAFLCPCHDGIFDVGGRVVSGPPPKPLDRLKTRVANGRIQILIPEV